MGVDRWQYLGPFTRSPKRPRQEPVSYYGCDKCDRRENDPAVKFCGKCGSTLAIFKRTVTRQISSNDLMEDMDGGLTTVSADSFMKQPHEYWYPNVRVEFLRDLKPDDNEDVIQVISPEQIQAEIQKYQDRFAKELDVIHKAYGSWTQHWGWLVWFN